MNVPRELASPRLTVDHAKAHIDEIESLAKTFFESKPYAVFTEPDPLYATHYLQYVRLVKPLPLRIPGLALDAVKNLRSALDQLGCAAAIAAGKSGKKAYFPFGGTAAEIEDRRTNRSKDIPKEIFDLMAAFKPYKGGNETLWRMNKLSNVSKHEHFVRAVLFTSQITYEGHGTTLIKNVTGLGTENEIPLAWIRRGASQPYHNIQLNTSIRFNDIGDLVFDQPAIKLLHDFIGITDRIIREVEAEGRRLNLFPRNLD